MLRLAGLAIALALAGCKKKDDRLGEGARCAGSHECALDYTCVETTQRCRAHAHPEAVAAREEASRSLAAAKEAQERAMLAQSGVTPTAELAPAAADGPAPAGAVQVRRAAGRGDAFAACRADERLVGGGCASGSAVSRSAPDAYGEADTRGARWTCRVANTAFEVEAYALCARLTEAEPGPLPAAVVGDGAP